MKTSRALAIPFVALILLHGYFGSELQARAASSGTSKTTALVGGKIHASPTAKPIENGVVLVRNGKIVAVGPKGTVRIPAGAETVDCTGLVVVAGFWNCHVHFTEPKWNAASALPSDVLYKNLRDMLTGHGFTTVFDTGSVPENTLALRRRIESGEVPGPRILRAGGSFVAKNGTPIYVRPVQLPEVESPEQAKAMVREVVGQGADAIKIFSGSMISEDGGALEMPLEIVKAITSEAHRLGKPVFAHPQSAAGVKVAVEGGVDILAHTAPNGGPWDKPLLDRMKQSEIAVIPTLKLWKFVLSGRNVPPSVAERFQRVGTEQLRAFLGTGGPVLFGTDVGFMTEYDPTDEYQRMAQAGMDFRAILAALTTEPAKRFKMSSRTGRVAVGLDADLVVLAGDPETDVKRFAEIRYVLRAGKMIFSPK